MLARTILFPCIFAVRSDTSVFYYNLVITILNNLTDSGIILIDNQLDESQLFKVIKANVEDWTPKFRPKAKELLKKLHKKNRFVIASVHPPLSQTCDIRDEGNCIKLFTAEEFTGIVVRQSHCIDNPQFTNRLTLLEDYSISPLQKKLNKRDYKLNKGEWNQDKFSEEILIPLFRDAKHIGIYDRWIGRSISEGRNNHQNTLRWFLEVFQQVATIGVGTKFEVYCGIDRKRSEVPLAEAVNSLRSFESEIKNTFSYFQLFIKEESFGSELPHDRYIITNQTAIYIGRGFDLFVDANESYPRRIRDVQIGYCSNPAEVQNHYKDRRLRDL